MTHLSFVLEDGTVFAVEVDPPQIAGPQPAGRLEDALRPFENALKPVAKMAGSIVSIVRDAIPDPDELEVCFGIKAAFEVDGFLVGKAGAEGNYSVKVTWKAVK